jgi:hypothetical protein
MRQPPSIVERDSLSPAGRCPWHILDIPDESGYLRTVDTPRWKEVSMKLAPSLPRVGRIGVAVSVMLGTVGFAGVLAALDQAGPAAASAPSPTIYVADASLSTISSFPLPSTGNVSPSATTTSSALDAPYSESFDAAGNLWVANYEGASLNEFTAAQLAQGGAQTPAVVLSSTANSLEGPVGLAFNAAGDLWVADYDGSSLSMFTPAQLAATGSPVPTLTMTSGTSTIDKPEEIAFDPSGNLWVTNNGARTFIEFTSAQLAAGGSPAPAVTISGSSLDSPEGIAFDASGDAWIGNDTAPTVLEFTPAQLATTGSPTPNVTIHDDGSGSSISDVYDMEFDSTGQLWIANYEGGVSGYSPAQLASSGSPAPANKLIGANTGFADPAGLALATPPQAPTGVTAALSGSTSATVTWNPLPGPVLPTDYFVTPVVNGVAQPTIDTGSTATSFSYGLHGEGPLSFTVSAANVFGTGPASAASNALNEAPGYWLVASDGGIFAEGSAGFHGSLGNIVLNKPIVGMAATPSGNGYWLVASDGGVFTEGDAKFYGSTGNIHLNKPIVGMASTPDGKGYWLVASDGGIFSFGDAQFYGSLGNIVLNKPIVGMASTPDGGGYWLVASDGGVFSKGNAVFHGSQGATRLNQPIVGMAATPDGGGYWLVASDGGIFTHGDANFYGSQGATKLNQPIVGMAATPDGGGYWLVASDGGIFSHGDATFGGSLGNIHLNKPIVGMAG